MKKIELATLVATISWQARKEKLDAIVAHPEGWKGFGEEEGKKYFVESASNAAETKLKKGRISLNHKYLVSRGIELPNCKPSAIAEYSSHWLYDYCYFYKI